MLPTTIVLMGSMCVSPLAGCAVLRTRQHSVVSITLQLLYFMLSLYMYIMLMHIWAATLPMHTLKSSFLHNMLHMVVLRTLGNRVMWLRVLVV